MKKSILITGIAGSGKSTVCEKLKQMGYTAYGIETIPELFTAIDKETKEPVNEYHNNNLEKIRKTEWICNKKKLATLLDAAPDGTTFYCGTSSNIQELTELFDKVFVLSASAEVLKQRLSTRTTHDFARSNETQEWLLSWKDNWEKYMQEHGAILIPANGTLDEVIKKILEKVD